MLARVLTALRRPHRRSATRNTAPPTDRRRKARAAVASGLVAFAALTAALAVTLETVRPEWRDPEYGRRLNAMRAWRAEAPGRPLVVALGSFRTQMSLSPAAMGFSDRPGSPIVCNLGYRGSPPVGSWVHLCALLDDGLEPAAVLVQLSACELQVTGPAGPQYARRWGPRLSAADVGRLARYAEGYGALREPWVLARLTPWTASRQAMLSDLLPEWQTPAQRDAFEWERADRYGFSPLRASPDQARSGLESVKRTEAPRLQAFTPGGANQQAVREIVAVCRSRGTPVSLFWSPESPAYRSWYSPGAKAAADEFGRQLAAEFGVAVFPAPDHLSEDDFIDGVHLFRPAAERYSRWLADHHLGPWLAAHGLWERHP